MNRLVTSLITCGLACWSCFSPVLSHAAENTSGRVADSGLVRIEQVEVRISNFGPVVLLKAQTKAIPIFVDATVAESIHAALSGEQLRRPLSHDLMRAVLEAFEGKVSQAVISLKDDTFYADLTVVLRDTVKVFDSRSSDAIALAVHFKAPVLVSKELLEAVGRTVDPSDEPKPGERRL
ncbi:MAG: bifunctional nuclease family protein [Betaproteobacteria bacterium]|nr:bifunctional nuclease family protein [Betaproteobacteria bacterium]